MAELTQIAGTMSAYLFTIAANVARAEETGHELQAEAISPMEVKLMEALLARGLRPKQQQQQIGRYYADFYFADARLVVEVDGRAYHEGRWRYDDTRDKQLRRAGIQTLRIPASFVYHDAERCAKAVEDLLDKLLLTAMAT